MSEIITPHPYSAQAGRQNRKTLAVIAAVVMGMVGLAYASVPLYKLFCQVTGFGGTTQVATEAPQTVIASAEPVTVRFDANVNPKLNWAFTPVTAPAELNPGEQVTAYYRVTNIGETASVGTATFNVTPQKAGPYFMKLECFCFTEQRLEAGQSMDMPVTFFLDPEMSADINTADVDEIVLSYTFFASIAEDG